MKFAALCSILFVLTCGGAAEARVGESPEACRDRYGPVIERRTPVLSASDPEALVFSKSGITVIVEFKDGVAWHVAFRNPKMDAVQVESLLLANSGSGIWSKGLTLAGMEYRLSADKLRLAAIETSGRTYMAVNLMTREWISANREEFLRRSPSPAGPAGNPAVNSLPGF
jgi:hypothetical protein